MSDLGNKEIFAKNLKKYMDIKNIDRNKLAQDLELAYTTVNEWYTATSYPRVEKIAMLAKYFGITKSDLIEDVENFKGKGIPIIGRIPAGMPFEAVQEVFTVDYIKPPNNWNKNPDNYFALTIVGTSMEPTYKNGDTVIFMKTHDVSSGNDCCVLIGNDDATFKRVTIKDDGLWLEPLNIHNDSNFLPKFYSAEQCANIPIKIIGVAQSHFKILD